MYLLLLHGKANRPSRKTRKGNTCEMVSKSVVVTEERTFYILLVATVVAIIVTAWCWPSPYWCNNITQVTFILRKLHWALAGWHIMTTNRFQSTALSTTSSFALSAQRNRHDYQSFTLTPLESPFWLQLTFSQLIIQQYTAQCERFVAVD